MICSMGVLHPAINRCASGEPARRSVMIAARGCAGGRLAMQRRERQSLRAT